MSTFIAEIKQASPFDGPSQHPEPLLRSTAIEHGDWVAAHTEAPWGGSIDHLKSVRDSMRRAGADKPLLAKGVHADDESLREALAVADYALVVGRWPHGLSDADAERVILEPYINDHAYLRGWLPVIQGEQQLGEGHPRVMWNARDLATGQRVSDYALPVAKHAWLLEWVCQASFIRSPADVLSGADAHIVGTYLMEYVEERAS